MHLLPIIRVLLVLLAFAAFLVLLPIPVSAQTVVLAESFETPLVASASGNGFDTYGPGEPLGDSLVTASNTWLVAAANIDHVTIQSVQSNFFTAHDGVQVVDLGGTPGAGIFETTFATVPGRTYALEFFYSHNDFGTETPAARVRVLGAGAGVLVESQVTHTISFQIYLQFNQTFVADSSSTRLEFVSQNAGFGGIALDSISVTELSPAVPAFSTLTPLVGLVAALGATGSIAIRRRRQGTPV